MRSRGALVLAFLGLAAVAAAQKLGGGPQTYRATIPVKQGSDFGHQIFLIHNRSSTASYTVMLKTKVYDRANAAYTFDRSVLVPAATLNIVTGRVAQNGAAMIDINLKETGFSEIARTELELALPDGADLPGVTWAVFLTAAQRPLVTTWADYKRFEWVQP